MAKLYIGTSGFSYGHWEQGVFYPKDLAAAKQLEYYSQHFQTVELNSSFYHLPLAKTFQAWYQRTPKNFIFAVKASRFITHIKKLKEAKEPWQRFIDNAKELKEKLGPILFQLSPNFQATAENTERLEKFIREICGQICINSRLYFVFEFRHPSWFCSEIYQIFRKYNIALCLADSPNWPYHEEITADFIYLRLHGGQILYGSNYSTKELKNWAGKIKRWRKQGLDIYVYFNNDAYGYAIKNAQTLISLIKKN